MRHAALLAPLAVALMTSACAVGPDYKAPDLRLTETFHAAPVASTATPATDRPTRTAFGDAELDRIVERVRAQNLELAEAKARVDQAHAAARSAAAALLPIVSANGGADTVRQSLQSPIGEVAGGLPGFKRDYNLYDAGVAAGWEIDLFGGLRRQREWWRVAQAPAAGDQVEAGARGDDGRGRRRLYGRARPASPAGCGREQEAVRADLADAAADRSRKGSCRNARWAPGRGGPSRGARRHPASDRRPGGGVQPAGRADGRPAGDLARRTGGAGRDPDAARAPPPPRAPPPGCVGAPM